LPGRKAERDDLTIAGRRDRAGPGCDLGDLQAPPRAYIVLPEVLEQLLIGLRFLRDALDHHGRAFLGLRERKRLDPRRLGHPGDRVAVRTRARHTQELGQTIFHSRRERVLEPMRLFVGVRPVQAERVGEPPLEQPMPARHHLGDLPALAREHQLLATSDLHVAAAGHAMDRLGDGRGRDCHVLGQPGADHRLAAAGQIVDRGQIVLDRGGRVSGFGRDFHS